MTNKTSAKNQTPGEYVREKILKPRKISVTDAAKLLGVGRPAFSNFLNGNSALSPEMASRIERAFSVPAQKLHNLQVSYDLIKAKTKGTPQNTNSYVPAFLDIHANEIENWFSSVNSRSRLAVFIRTLIHSTGVELSKVDFPGNDDSERSGWDGFVSALEGTPWIPKGNSGWEFGCNQEPKPKADKDYTKNIRLIDKSERNNITFVFITPKRWPGKGKWIDECKEEGEWKDVRAYDSSDLEQWISQSIAGQTWFSNETKRPQSHGTRSLDRCWTDWASITNPPLTGALFKTALENAKTTVISKLAKPPEEPIIITADSVEEAIAFLGELFNSDIEELVKIRDRVVIFDQSGVLPKLAEGASNFIAVASTREVERELATYYRSIHSIVVYPRNAINTEPDVQLEPLNYHEFHSALDEVGYSQDEINKLENESGRSLTVLRRRLSKIPAIRTPEWVSDKDISSNLIPFLFAGTWSSSNQCDQIILSSLSNETPYIDLEKQLQKTIQLNDSPVWSLGTNCGVVSKIDLLFAISGVITKSEIETYFDVARLVLSEDDPSLDLPEKDRMFAALYGKTREISGPLRSGICETLVLLAVHGNNLFQKRLGLNIEAIATSIVRELLGDPLTTRKLEAHDRDLPTYAEVAPEAFLKILENDLKAASPAIFGLMRSVDSELFWGGCPRTGLLWALENLAWSPNTIHKTARILAKLAEIKIEDNWANKPISSLNAIFSSWVPQTAANLDQRISVLQSIVKDFPKIAWEICMKQLGHENNVGIYSHKPRWRNDAHGFGEPVKTNAEVYAFKDKVIDIVLSWSRYDKFTIGNLIERLSNLNEKHQDVVWNIVKDWATTASDLDKAWIREKIRVNFLSRRGVLRKKKQLINKIDSAAKAAYNSLEPDDILNKFEWLFRQTWVEESYDEIHDEEINFHLRQEKITKLRSDALQAIYNDRGIDGIFVLSEMGKTSFQIGLLMVAIIPSSDELLNFVLKILQSPNKIETWTYKNLIMGVLRSINDIQKRNELLYKAKEVLSPKKFVKLLEHSPFCQTTWDVVSGLEEPFQQLYWTSVSPDGYQQSDEEINELVEKLLTVKRPRAAFSCVHYELERLRPILLYKLMNVLASENNEEVSIYQLQSYDLEKAFKILDESDTFSVEQMAGLELAYIDVLFRQWEEKENRGILNLEKYIDTHPEFFAQVVAWVYKRNDDGIDPEGLKLDDPVHIQNRAQRGYKLLEGLKYIPGRDRNGDINTNQLLWWVKTVRNECSKLGRQNVGDISLGKLFAEALEGIDGVWPCEPVRDVLEQIQSDEISHGMTIGRHNARGVHARGEGGGQERKLSTIFRSWASELEFSHPFVFSTILKQMADDYERQAESEDTEAGIRRRLR